VTDFTRELLDLLQRAGFTFLRHGKGSHDMWRNPTTGKSVAIPHKIPSRHFANKLLKDAGLPKAF
jgi:predicted RNA binding protein YcfA (HicA-like mRNA interferase family)